MSRNYKFHNPVGVYFVSFAVVEWIDVLTRNEYKDILPQFVVVGVVVVWRSVFRFVIAKSKAHALHSQI